MTYFLERIASMLYDEYGDRLDRHCLVFPNRRAGLYFLKYLAAKADKPLWSPGVKTINELFGSFSTLRLAENELLVFELYRTYKELNPRAGSLDEFFFWGEMVVNDFDDVDKHLVDAGKLFVNIADIKEIDAKFGGLTEEQIAVIKEFWVNFNPLSLTDEKSGFKEIWSILHSLYTGYRLALSSADIAYEGMIYREVAEKCLAGEKLPVKWDLVHFIGFNALNSCEKEVMSYLGKAGHARFYWDYDKYFVTENPGHSAGFFIRENLKLFGNDMPADWRFSSFSERPDNSGLIKVIDSSSDIAQVKLAGDIVASSPHLKSSDAHHTAIILADENLLLPVLTSLPWNVESINITMGYPLKFSPVYNLISDILNLQKNLRSDNEGKIIFDSRDVHNILRNSFFADSPEWISSVLVKELESNKEPWIDESFFKDKAPFDLIFKKVSDAYKLSIYLKTILEKLYFVIKGSDDNSTMAVGISIRNEFIYRIILAMNRLTGILSDKENHISINTYNRLLDRILRGLSIPFSGEPLNGIQIMGILETRSLDFRDLIILSVNEGVLPRSSSGNSFIPYNLREAFGLPTIRHQDSIYAYYFYRLLQRAENVTLIYNSSSDGMKTGEMSRFLLQMKFGANPPFFASQRFEIKAPQRIPGEIKREQVHHEILYTQFFGDERKLLSPSAVNTWLTCRMKFFYRYVCGIKEAEKISREIDPAMFGELLHLIMEKIYAPYKKTIVDRAIFDLLLKNSDLLQETIEGIINEKFYNGLKVNLSGNDLIISSILKSYIQMVLKYDSGLAPLEIAELEYPISSERLIDIPGCTGSVRTGGVVDRIDRTGGIYRITDYKTGKTVMEIPSVESLFDEERNDRNGEWFQILMYCNVLVKQNSDSKLRPVIYAIRGMSDSYYSDYLKVKDMNGMPVVVDDYSLVSGIFDHYLQITIENIFNPDESFMMTEHLKKCEYCPYSRLCQR
jgi:CRISPR/Cas system-associated exonuclease Cas4 (RecB family)